MKWTRSLCPTTGKARTFDQARADLETHLREHSSGGQGRVYGSPTSQAADTSPTQPKPHGD